jgi:hypothetical protein
MPEHVRRCTARPRLVREGARHDLTDSSHARQGVAVERLQEPVHQQVGRRDALARQDSASGLVVTLTRKLPRGRSSGTGVRDVITAVNDSRETEPFVDEAKRRLHETVARVARIKLPEPRKAGQRKPGFYRGAPRMTARTPKGVPYFPPRWCRAKAKGISPPPGIL